MALSTTAEPMPWVASPKAAVLPGTSDSVSRR
jgi:hypothetical protein